MRRLHTPDDLEGLADEALYRVIRQRFIVLATDDDNPFDELAEFWLVEPGDTIEALEAATQAPITYSWFNDAHYPDPDFSPSWEVLEAHASAYEMVFITNDAGYGVVLWIPATGSDTTLLVMCAEYASLAPPVENVKDAAT